jgi:hypothetical protein
VDKYETVKVAPLYEIHTLYPYEIRKKSDHRIVSRFFDKSAGYVRTNLYSADGNRKEWLLHRVIAIQWIPNPEDKSFVDHIDGDHENYHLENLRWVTGSENSRNFHSNKGIPYEFVDELPKDAFEVDQYGNHDIENLYYSDDKFYLWNGVNYRILRICTDKNGVQMVNVKDTNDKSFQVRYTVFKRTYNLY